MLDNTHSSQVVLEPNQNYIKEAQIKEIQNIEAEALVASIEEKTVITDNKIALEKWQTKDQGLGILPQLRLEDINQSMSLPQLTIKVLYSRYQRLNLYESIF